MSEQQGFAFSQLWPVPRAPYSGSTATTLEASKTGSDRVTPTHTKKAAQLLELFRTRGPLTLNACSEMLGWPLSSICSLKAAIASELVEVDTVQKTWNSGRATTRTRWRVKR